MYYVDYLAMIASSLKPSLNSVYRVSRLGNKKRLSLQKQKQSLIKPLLASICFLLCIAFVPEKPTNLSSICQKYNSSVACQVW
tara:strand:+ start:2608 stop:2856 length:249 start_codon:yes stop_codon:yes gene_type:complete